MEVEGSLPDGLFYFAFEDGEDVIMRGLNSTNNDRNGHSSIDQPDTFSTQKTPACFGES